MSNIDPRLDPSPMAEQAEYEIKSSAPEQRDPRVPEELHPMEGSADRFFVFVVLLPSLATLVLAAYLIGRFA